MAKKYIICVHKDSTGKNPFGMKEPDTTFNVYCSSLKELRETLRALTPRGYRVPKAPSLSRRLKDWADSYGITTLFNPFFKTTMFEIQEITTVTHQLNPFTATYELHGETKEITLKITKQQLNKKSNEQKSETTVN